MREHPTGRVEEEHRMRSTALEPRIGRKLVAVFVLLVTIAAGWELSLLIGQYAVATVVGALVAVAVRLRVFAVLRQD
jgi:hypothetical protein